jgi:hypothetical protein
VKGEYEVEKELFVEKSGNSHWMWIFLNKHEQVSEMSKRKKSGRSL